MELAALFSKTCRLCCMTNCESFNVNSLFGGTDGRSLAAKIAIITGMKNSLLDLPPSNRDQASVSYHTPDPSSVIQTSLPENFASDFKVRTQSSTVMLNSLVGQYTDISQLSPATNVTAVNNSLTSSEGKASVLQPHDSTSSACQITPTHGPEEDRTHENDNQTGQSRSSDNTATNVLSPSCYVIHQSVSSNSNDLHHKPEARSSGSTPRTMENSLSTTVLQDTAKANPSKNVQEKCQDESVQELFSSTSVFPEPGHAVKTMNRMHSSVCLLDSSSEASEKDVNKLDTSISKMLGGTYDCRVNVYNRNNAIQKPHLNYLTRVCKSLSNTKNDKQVCSSEDEKNNLICGQVRVHDVVSRSVHNSENNATVARCTQALQTRNERDTVSETTADLKNQLCATTVVENATLLTVKVINSVTDSSSKPTASTDFSHESESLLPSAGIQPFEEFTDCVTHDMQKANRCSYTAPNNIANVSTCALKEGRVPLPEVDRNLSKIEAPPNIPQHTSSTCSIPPLQSVPVPEPWQQLHGIHRYISKSVGPIPNVNNKNAPLISGLGSSYNREYPVIKMKVAPQQQIRNKTPLHKVETSPTITEIPASTSKMLLRPSEISEIVRTIGSKLGVFLENDDIHGNASQVTVYSVPETVPSCVTPESNIPQHRRNLSQPYQTSDSATLQAERNVMCSTGQRVQVPMSNTYQNRLYRNINNQPQTSLPLSQTQIPQVMSCNAYRTLTYVPNNFQGSPLGHASCVSKSTEQSERVSEEQCSGKAKRRKSGPPNKSSTSKQNVKKPEFGCLFNKNLQSLMASIKVAFPNAIMIPTQEELQSIMRSANQENQLGVLEMKESQFIETTKKSARKRQCNESSGAEKNETQQDDVCPKVLSGKRKRLNKLHSFSIKITKTNGKYRSSSVQKYSQHLCHNPHSLSTPENSQLQNAAREIRPYIRISQLRPYQLAPFVSIKRLKSFFVPNVTYKLTDINVINLLDEI
ncbi:uncharacterized protein LOC111874327 isoform X2 [Cryptotermes secundus]|uniref:uncharacterized protein LOC111874327 isoform X2 n=1 Tax=Cryptotermes secundus TaxID=105785 RepID=UPI000CD7B450|nr:uncharacterized protein LOC111874327 isoform X2 [Cryptotermes secundus]